MQVVGCPVDAQAAACESREPRAGLSKEHVHADVQRVVVDMSRRDRHKRPIDPVVAAARSSLAGVRPNDLTLDDQGRARRYLDRGRQIQVRPPRIRVRQQRSGSKRDGRRPARCRSRSRWLSGGWGGTEPDGQCDDGRD
jgi:hypothetical protein